MSVDLTSLAIRIESQEAETAKARLDSLADSGLRAETSTGQLSRGVDHLTSRLTAMAAAAAATKVLYDVMAAGREFGGVMAQLSAVTGATSQQLQLLRDDVLALSRDTIFSASEIGAGFRQIAADGDGLAETSDEIRRITEASVLLATATSSDLQPAIDAVTVSLRQFRATSADAGYFAGILATLGPTANELRDVSAALNQAGDTAAVLKVPLEDVAGALQVLARRGIEGSEAGGGLRLVMQQLEQEADVRLRPSMVGLAAALEAASDANYQFQGRAFAVGGILRDQSDAIEANSQALRESADVKAQAGRAMDSLAGDTQKLSVALNALKINLSEGLDPTLRDTTQSTTGLIDTFNRWLDFTQEAGRETNVLGAIYQGLTDAVGGLAGGFALLYGTAVAAGGALVDVLTKDLTGPPDDGAAAWDRYTQALRRAIQTEQDFIPKGPQGPRRDAGASDRADEARRQALENEQRATQAVLDEIENRYVAREEAIRRAADREIAQLASIRTFNEDQERQRTDTILAIEADRDARLAEIRQKRVDEERRAAEQRRRIAEEEARAVVQASNLQSTIQISLAVDNPMEQERLRFEQQMAQLEQQAQPLIERRLLKEQEFQAQLTQLRAQFAERETAQMIEQERSRDAQLMALRAEAAASDVEAEQLRLDARLLASRSRIVELVGSEEEAIRLIADIRAKGYADIEKRAEDAARRERDLALRARQERLRIAADTAIGLVALVSGGSEKAFKLQQAAAIASAAMNIPESASDAYKWGTKFGGPIAGAAAATVAVAAQVGHLMAIKSQTFGGESGYSTGGYGGGGGFALSNQGQLFNESGVNNAPRLADLRRSEEFPTFERQDRTVFQPPAVVVEAPEAPSMAGLEDTADRILDLMIRRESQTYTNIPEPVTRASVSSFTASAQPEPVLVSTDVEAPGLDSLVDLLLRREAQTYANVPQPVTQVTSFTTNQPAAETVVVSPIVTVPGIDELVDLMRAAQTFPEAPEPAVQTFTSSQIITRESTQLLVQQDSSGFDRLLDYLERQNTLTPAIPQSEPQALAPVVQPVTITQAAPQIMVEVINNGRPADATVEMTTAADGTQIARIMLNEVATDISTNGVIAQTLQAKYGLQQQLGVRG